MDIKNIVSIPGIAKLVTVVIGIIDSILALSCTISAPRPVRGPGRSSGSLSRSYANIKARATFFGVVQYGGPAACNRLDIAQEDFFISMAVIWTMLSIGNLVVFVFINLIVPQEKLKLFKLVVGIGTGGLMDIISHLIGGFFLFVAGCVEFYFASTLRDCQCELVSHFVPEDYNCGKDVNFPLRVVAGLFCFFNGLIFFGVAFAIFKLSPPDANGAPGQQQQLGNQNSQYPPMDQGVQPTPKESNQVANQPPPIQTPSNTA